MAQPHLGQHPGWVHDHPAVRQELLPEQRADLRPQAGGGADRGQGRPPAQQGPDPGDYLNTIYYGRGAYGIQTAAQAYFDKGAQDLTIAEGAFLAAVTNAPALLDPDYAEGNEERARERFAYVIEGMVGEGWLAQEQADALAFPDVQDTEATSATTGTAGYISTEVRAELVDDLGVSEEEIDGGGLRIVTTIEQDHQEAAETAVETMMPTTDDAQDLQVGLVAVRPGDGAITAMYGGEDYSERQLNNATDASLHAGSLFKVFTLLAAVDQRVSTLTQYPGPSPMEFDIEGDPEPYVVNNFRDEQFGLIDLRTATANSVNTVYVQLNQQVGPEATVDAALAAGIPQDVPGLEADLSNVLGPAAPTVVEMAGAYSTIAAEGEYAEPYLISSVADLDTTIYEVEVEPEERLDPEVTADVIDAMTTEPPAPTTQDPPPPEPTTTGPTTTEPPAPTTSEPPPSTDQESTTDG